MGACREIPLKVPMRASQGFNTPAPFRSHSPDTLIPLQATYCSLHICRAPVGTRSCRLRTCCLKHIRHLLQSIIFGRRNERAAMIKLEPSLLPSGCAATCMQWLQLSNPQPYCSESLRIG